MKMIPKLLNLDFLSWMQYAPKRLKMIVFYQTFFDDGFY